MMTPEPMPEQSSVTLPDKAQLEAGHEVGVGMIKEPKP